MLANMAVWVLLLLAEITEVTISCNNRHFVVIFTVYVGYIQIRDLERSRRRSLVNFVPARYTDT